MRLLVTMVTVMVAVCDELMVVAAAQSRCDPLTQYEKAGQCCRMCFPGTSMSSTSTCTDPQCEECGEDEYQDKYNTEPRCQRQPYCNPLKNFQASAQQSKKKRSTCLCRLGFHCSSEACMTCVPHTTCKAGHGTRSIGNQTHDTVCQECPEGSFSISNTWDSVCEKWTECQSGYHVRERGTDVSDSVCEETSRQHVALIAVFAVAACLVGALGVVFCLFRGDAKRRAKGCVDLCHGDRWELPKEPSLLSFTPVDQTEKVPMCPELQSIQDDEDRMRTPEENEDDLRDDMSADVVALTENGKFVTQERGKTEIQPQQESQTHTYTD
ncbi:Tumor necrosis factor receptor superfamily member 5 [Scophthalmus maximus]|uniref:Tumor necrosis factor receptor superfamily member 5 n=1 Tax=Scophthalmus maximus TaxID=52904 RepID=A0A2U9C0T6_SCOMX|nr:tumor necrosis factor receptor superfamily member 5 [Scophthalmus maximus]AWP10121.1 Tumor necrosis factor receptor superfamily member 5 [Scophthalmus maximus]